MADPTPVILVPDNEQEVVVLTADVFDPIIGYVADVRGPVGPQGPPGPTGSGAAWGDITGTLSDQTDLQAVLDAKEPTITAGTTSQYYRGDKTFQTLNKLAVGLGNVDNTSDSNKPISTATQIALDSKVDENSPITGSTKTKITYDSKGLVTSGVDATTADIADSTNKRYVTDANLVVINNTSGVNTGDQDLSGLELISNKSTNVNTDQASNTKYPSVKAVFDWAIGLFIPKNSPITSATKTKITYDSNGLVTSATDATTADIASSFNKRYVTDANITVINNTSGFNTGDQFLNDTGPGETIISSSLTTKVKKLIAGTNITLTPGTDGITVASSGGGGTPGGSNTQVQFNDSGAFAGDSNLLWDKDADSLNIQTEYKQHPLHVNASTGATISDVSVLSATLEPEVLPTSPTGTITLIEEFPAGSSATAFANSSGGGYSANGQTIDYRIYSALNDGSSYYISQYFQEISFTDSLSDSSSFSVIISSLTVLDDQTHWYIEKQVNGMGYSDSILTFADTSYEDSGFSGSASGTAWPTYYSLNYNPPVAGTIDTIAQENSGFGNLTADGKTYSVEMRAAVQIGGVWYCDTNTFSNSWTDPNDMSSFDLGVYFTNGSGDENVGRISSDGGSSWSYHFFGNGGSYVWYNPGNDSDAEAAWSNDVATASIEYAFKCYGKGYNASSSAIIYSTSSDNYYGEITTPNVNYIFKHTFTSLPAAGGKVLGDYNQSVTNGRNVTGEFFDVGYVYWVDGTALTPNSYGLSGSSQNTQIRAVGYSSSLQIYSQNPLVISTSSVGGSRYISGSIAYPSGVTQIKVSININGAGYTIHKVLNSPSTSFTYDTLDSSWNSSSTISPTSSVPSTVRLDLARTSPSQISDNLAIVETSGSGARYPSIVFGVASNTNSPYTLLSRISSNSSTGHFLIGSARTIGYTNNQLSTESYTLGDVTAFNLQKSSSNHPTFWAADLSRPLAYFYSAGDSNRGTAYFGQSTTSFGGSSKVCIAPTAGGTTALYIRRTSGATGDAITIDENGSLRGGWNSTGRMYLNASTYSSTTFLNIGGVPSGSQVRLSASTGSGTTEGDIWNDTTQKSFVKYVAGLKQFDTRTSFAQTSNGTCVNTTTETTISNAGVGSLTLPANFFTAGKTIRVKAYGYHSSTASPNLTIKVKLGTTVVCTTGTHSLHNGTNHIIDIEAMITCRTTGSSGTLMAQGRVLDQSDVIPMVNTSTVSINTTIAQAITITAQWGTASSSNTITLTNLAVEVLA